MNPVMSKAMKSKNNARKSIKDAFEGFCKMCAFAPLVDLRESWNVIHQFVQPYDEDDSDDPYANEPEDGVLTVAGLDDICWDADDVRYMLEDGDVAGALAEVDRFVSLAFGDEKDLK